MDFFIQANSISDLKIASAFYFTLEFLPKSGSINFLQKLPCMRPLFEEMPRVCTLCNVQSFKTDLIFDEVWKMASECTYSEEFFTKSRL